MYQSEPYILLIDDDEDDLELFSSGLELKGVRVKSFNSSAKALFYLTLMAGNRELPALIIMDYNMPQNNGREVLALIKANPDTRDIPVVIFSTSMTELLRIQLMAAGALDSFNKPWNYQEFTHRIETLKKLSHSFMSHRVLA
jgi:CheY-like chemotaxis protein